LLSELAIKSNFSRIFAVVILAYSKYQKPQSRNEASKNFALLQIFFFFKNDLERFSFLLLFKGLEFSMRKKKKMENLINL